MKKYTYLLGMILITISCLGCYSDMPEGSENPSCVVIDYSTNIDTNTILSAYGSGCSNFDLYNVYTDKILNANPIEDFSLEHIERPEITPNPLSINPAIQKKYTCRYEGCDKSFTRKDNRKAHEKSVHEGVRYFCTYE